jgi:uncharacterized membrane-anchored protein YhcB (DUF1043 family)
MQYILWAELVPQSDPTAVGTWVLVAMGLVGGGLAIAKLVKELVTKPSDKEAVTKKEFEDLKSSCEREEKRLTDLSTNRFEEVKANLHKLDTRFGEYIVRREFDDHRSNVGKQLESLDKYCRSRINRLAGQTHEIQMKIEVLHRNIQTEMSGLTDKIYDRLDKLQRTMLEIRAVMDHRLPRRPDKISDDDGEETDAK